LARAEGATEAYVLVCAEIDSLPWWAWLRRRLLGRLRQAIASAAALYAEMSRILDTDDVE
jgi:hypothetical protein